MRTAIHYGTAGDIISWESWSFNEDPKPDPGSAGVIVINEGKAPGDLDSKTYFVNTSAATPELQSKQAIDNTHNITGLTVVFTGLPMGTLVKVGNDSVESDATDTTIDFELPGSYRIKLLPPSSYLDQTLEVTVNG